METYYAVIFTSELSETTDGYESMAERMVELAQQQEGFLGIESARSGIGITVSYWKDLKSIRQWKQNLEHLAAQSKGRSDWYKNYKVRIALVEHEYDFKK